LNALTYRFLGRPRSRAVRTRVA